MAFETRNSSRSAQRKATGFFERAVQLDPNFALAWSRLSRVEAHRYFEFDTPPAVRREAAKRALEKAQKLEPNSPETLLALGYYQYWVPRDYALAKTTFSRVSKILPGSSEVPFALGAIARREGHWDESIAYFEQALALDPRNMQLVVDAAWTYAMVRQFPAALKLYDLALDITPNNPLVMMIEAGIYQAQGNLQEAARFLSEVNSQTPDEDLFLIKITQLRLERNYSEAIRLLQARQAQFQFASSYDKTSDQVVLALIQRLTGDAAGAKVTAEQARNIFEQLYDDRVDSPDLAVALSQTLAATGERNSALKLAEHAMMLLPRAKDAVNGPGLEENMAFIYTIFGENSRAISSLSQLLQTPYKSWVGPTPITPALLRLDPIWDPLRERSRLPKTLRGKAAITTNGH